MKFDCRMCAGICCVNPPMIINFQELKFAVSKGVEVVAVEHENGGYMLAVGKKDDVCPFKDGDKCGIYNERFEACKKYTCPMMDKPLDEARRIINNFEHLRTQLPHGEPYRVANNTLKKFGIKPMPIEKAIKKTIATDIITVLELMQETNRKIEEVKR